MIVIDAENSRVGRVGTFAAKQLLKGEEVHIINAEKAVISGNKTALVEKYQHRRRLRYKGDPERSPTWSNTPHLFVKRLLRGMLNRKKQSGRDAYRKLRVYSGKPEGLKGEPMKVEGAELGALHRYMRVGELCKLLGHTR